MRRGRLYGAHGPIIPQITALYTRTRGKHSFFQYGLAFYSHVNRLLGHEMEFQSFSEISTLLFACMQETQFWGVFCLSLLFDVIFCSCNFFSLSNYK